MQDAVFLVVLVLVGRAVGFVRAGRGVGCRGVDGRPVVAFVGFLVYDGEGVRLG